MTAVRLHRGDCLDILDTLPADHFDAVVTDPPYHLTSIVRRFGADGAAAAKPGTDGLFQRGSRGFMGQTWDGGDIAFRPETWAKVLRVLKPGGHLVAFNHSRTWHHMAVAIEAAGFEARDSILDIYDTGPAWAGFLDTLTADQARALRRALATADAPMLAWLYGTGFPKSHNVAAGIDKLRHDGDDVLRVTAWIRETRDAKGLRNRDIDAAFGFSGMAGHWTSNKSQPAVPTLDQVPRLLEVFGMVEADIPDDIARLLLELNGNKGTPGAGWLAREVVGSVTYGRSDAGNWAHHVDGGMFKPGTRDHAVTAPTETAAPWAGWGTALKPAFEPIFLARKPITAGSVARQHLATGTGGLNIDAARIPSDRPTGWGGKAAGGNTWTPENNGLGKDGAARPVDGRWPANVTTDGARATLCRFPVDADGTVARFFYSAKADAADRAGSDHPTVKPQALMRWLVRLVTPRGGLVLDPFGGSGSTGWAAWAEGRQCELIERDPAYADHIAARAATLDGPPPAPADTPATQPDLFGA